MTAQIKHALDYEEKRPAGPIRDDVAYFLPMLVFMLFTWLGTSDSVKGLLPAAYPVSYVAKTVIVAGLLVWLWPCYTRVRWNHWWLGVVVGVVGIFQWVGMQRGLQQFEFFKPSEPTFWNEATSTWSPAMLWTFIAIRLAGAVLVVPVMEELFWRDFLWRTIIAPNDFKLAAVGEWDWKAFAGVAVAFAFVHGNWWLTSIVWALMIGALLVYTKSLGACIIAHAVTNLLLGAYVLWTKDWAFW